MLILTVLNSTQGGQSLLPFIVLAILVMAIMVMAVVIFVIMYYQRVTKNKLVLEELKISQQEELIRSITEIQESERKRISARLHDEVGAALSSINLLVGRVRMGSEGKTRELAQDAGNQISEVVTEIRNIVQSMSPSSVERFGLVDAINDICNKMHRAGNINCEFTKNFEVLDIPDKSDELILYRIIQELANNALKYSGAENFTIDMNLHDELLKIEVRDNGIGFEEEEAGKKKSFGLVDIKNKVSILNGVVKITSYLNKGTLVEIDIPASRLFHKTNKIG